MTRIESIAGAIALLAVACARPSAPSQPASDAAPRETWSAASCGSDGWCWGYPRPIGTKLNRLWGTSSSDVWAVGDGGTIAHFDGAHWSRVPSGTGESLVAISGGGPGDAWAIGKKALLRLSEGAWHKVDLQGLHGEEELADVLALASGEAWIVGGMTKKTVTTDEEITSHCLVGRFYGPAARMWKLDEELGCGPLTRVWGRTPDDVWADGGNVVHWNGRYLTLNPKEKPAPIVGRHGYASGWKMESGGGGSAPLVDPRRPKASPGNVRDFWAWGPDDVWAISPNGALTHFDGRRWSRGDDPSELRAVAARAPDDVWAIASDSSLLHYDGRDWRTARLPAPHPVAIAAPSENDLWVLTADELLHGDGKRWVTVASAPPSFSSFVVRGPNDVWVAAGTKLRHWNGQAVETIDTDFNASLVVGDAHELWAGWPLHRWDGSKFVAPSQAILTAVKTPYFSAVAMGGGTLWLVERNRISRLAGGHLELVKELEKQPKDASIPVLNSLWVSPSGDIWAGGSHIVHGKGDTWTMSESPGYDVRRVGGADGLVWALGRDGVLFRDVR